MIMATRRCSPGRWWPTGSAVMCSSPSAPAENRRIWCAPRGQRSSEGSPSLPSPAGGRTGWRRSPIWRFGSRSSKRRSRRSCTPSSCTCSATSSSRPSRHRAEGDDDVAPLALPRSGRDAGRVAALPVAPRATRPLSGSDLGAAAIAGSRFSPCPRHEPIGTRPWLLRPGTVGPHARAPRHAVAPRHRGPGWGLRLSPSPGGNRPRVGDRLRLPETAPRHADPGRVRPRPRFGAVVVRRRHPRRRRSRQPCRLPHRPRPTDRRGRRGHRGPRRTRVSTAGVERRMKTRGTRAMVQDGLSALDAVRGFQGLRALVVGDAMLDSYVDGVATRLCKEGPVPVLVKAAEHHAPGGAANVAVNLRALGAEVVFVGLLGRDRTGEELRAALRERQVDDRWLIEDSGCATIRKLRILADDQYVVRVDEGETRTCGELGRRRMLEAIEAAFPRCDLVVVPDYGYGVASEEVIDCLRRLRSGRRVALAVDAKDLRRFASAGATVVTPNYAEVCAAIGEATAGALPSADPARAERGGRRLLELIDAEFAAVTLAGDGVVLVDRAGRATHLPAHPVPHAGD